MPGCADKYSGYMRFRDPVYQLRAELGTLPRNAPLVAALKGYADAGSVVELFNDNLLEHLESQPVVWFDPDELLDYRSRRPVAYLEADRLTEISRPSLQLSLLHDQTGAPFYLLHGFEPDFRWNAFLKDLTGLIDDLEMSTVTWMHSIPMPVPHTRPASSAVSGNRPEIIEQFSVWHPTTSMPAAALHVLEYDLIEAGYDVAGFVMLTPHYLAETEYPPAAVAATERVAVATGLALPSDDLREEAHDFTERLNEQVADNAELQTMVANLEVRHDEYLKSLMPGALSPDQVPSADEIGAEFESFLARQPSADDDTDSGPTLS